MHGESRLGQWRIARKDGGSWLDWYDGKDGGHRCGWWRLLDAKGALIAEGFCLNGKPTGLWRMPDADGGLELVPFASLPPAFALGEDPALPPLEGLGDQPAPAINF